MIGDIYHPFERRQKLIMLKIVSELYILKNFFP